jgi:4-aminobutyrate aminotransferase-like enzyme
MTTHRRLLSTSLTAGESQDLRVVGGHGAWFQLADGREVIDASNTAAPLGHCHPEIIEAIRGAAGAPVLNEGWQWAERDEAADDLIKIAFDGEDWAGAVRFFISASEANDAVLALCQALTGRAPLATRERAYHGGAGLARDLTVQPQWHGGLSSAKGIFAPPRLATVHELPAPAGARVTGQADPTAGQEWTDGASAQLAGSAAVLLDYSQGGIYHTPHYQDKVAALAREAGAYWIADETVTGFGRVGGWFQFQHGQSRPDFVTLGKCMSAGGAPAGAVVLSEEVLDSLSGTSWQSYSTYRAHPVAMAALRAHLRVSSRDRIYERALGLDAYMFSRLSEVAERHPSVARGRPRPALDGGAARAGLAQLARPGGRAAGQPGGGQGAGGRGPDRHQRRADVAVPGAAAGDLGGRARPGLRRAAPRAGRRRPGVRGPGAVSAGVRPRGQGSVDAVGAAHRR